MSYLHLASLAAFCFAISQIISKLMSKHTLTNRDSILSYFMISTFAFGICLLPFVSLSIPSFETLLLILGTTIAFLFGSYCFYTGIFEADATTFAPIFQLQAGIIALLAYIFLGERFPVQNYVWMILLVVGAVLVSIDEKTRLKSFFSRGVLFILAMQVFHSVSNIFVGFALRSIDPLQVIFWENMLIGVAAVLFIKWRRPKLNYPLKTVAPMFVSSFIVGVGVISLFSAFAQNLTISSVIGMLSAPIVFVATIGLSMFFPDLLEHHTPQVYALRALGLVIILTGAYFVSLGV